MQEKFIKVQYKHDNGFLVNRYFATLTGACKILNTEFNEEVVYGTIKSKKFPFNTGRFTFYKIQIER